MEQGVKEEIKNLFKNLKADISTWPKTNELEKCHIKTNSTYYGQDVDKEYFYKKITELEEYFNNYINNLLGIFNSDPNIIQNQRQFSRKSSSNNNNTNNDNNGYLSNSDVIKLLAEVMTNSIKEILDFPTSVLPKIPIGIISRDFFHFSLGFIVFIF